MSKKLKRLLEDKLLIGRNEWCALPQLHIPAIKAKIDTGAQTSALHAFNIRPVTIKNKAFVKFDVHPVQGNKQVVVHCKAPMIDRRYVMSSNGHKEYRYVISTPMTLGGNEWDIQLTLSNRDPLRYRMLLGREALENRVLIHPGISCHQGKVLSKTLLSLYKFNKLK